MSSKVATVQNETEQAHVEEKKLTFRKYEDGDYQWEKHGDNIFAADTSNKCPTYVHRTPPCQGSCPSGEDIRGWLSIVRGIEKPKEGESMQEYAFQRSTAANPFPSMMGRVCPAPCQDGCNRNHVEDYVGINAVEQYIGDYAYEKKFEFKEIPPLLEGKKVAIIGGGPAGLSAAYHLRRKGYASIIFDEHEELGGMMRYGIPNYRTPRAVLQHEIDRILAMGGIEVRALTRVGKDELKEIDKECDAVIWTIGSQSGRALPIPGGDASNCVSGVGFLEAFNKGDLKATAGRVVCVGGGDTSIDVVSVARRLGKVNLTDKATHPEYVIGGYVAHDAAFSAARTGSEVTLTSLFELETMTASEHEIQDALKEGVTIVNGVMPVEVILDDEGRAKALKMAKCKMEDGRPSPIEGTEFEIACTLVVSAIGQGGDLEGLDEFNNGRGFMDVDAFYAMPGHVGHFAAGDIVRPHLLTTAIGQGSVAADSVAFYLSGKEPHKRPKVDVHHFNLLDKLKETGLSPEDFSGGGQWATDDRNFSVHNYEDRSSQEVIAHDRLYLGHFGYVDRIERAGCGPDADHVLGHFEERVKCLEDQQAVEEADRCMSCGMCFECDNCVIYCPQDAVFRVDKKKSTMGRYVDTDYDRCIGCHICADVCPTGYIDMALGDH